MQNEPACESVCEYVCVYERKRKCELSVFAYVCIFLRVCVCVYFYVCVCKREREWQRMLYLGRDKSQARESLILSELVCESKK